MSKKIISIYICIFIVIMCMPHFAFLVCRNFLDTGNYENRNLATIDEVWESEYDNMSHKFEEYYNDHLPFRNQLIGMINRINYYVFHSTLSDQVMIGREGWLYLEDPMQGNPVSNYTGEDILTEEELKQIADNLNANKEYLASRGTEFVIFIAPNKSRVYSEYMPSYIGEPAQEYAVKQLVDYLENNTDIRVVYAYDSLMATKAILENGDVNISESDGEDILYHKADTHWNSLGAYIGTKELIEELGVADFADITNSELGIRKIANEEADLAAMLHMTRDFSGKEKDYEITGITYNETNLEGTNAEGIVHYSSEGAHNSKTLFMCRDSYSINMLKYITPVFEQSYFQHHDSYTPDNLETVNPDIYVYEVVERSAVYKLSNLRL